MSTEQIEHPEEDQPKPGESKLTPKARRFGDLYVVSFNGTQAAIDAGYSKRSASSIAWENLRKPEIRQYIDAKLEEQSLGKPETLKGISDLARGTLNPYFRTRHIVKTPKVKIGLGEYKERKQSEIDKAESVYDIAKADGLLGSGTALAKATKAHKSYVNSLKLELIALDVELTHNPEAYRIIDGDPELVEVADLDLPALTRDESVRIKSMKMTEFGPQVEICAPDAALVNLAKIHGLFEKDNNQKQAVVEIKEKVLKVEIVNPTEDDD